jgi:hypothetical protein
MQEITHRRRQRLNRPDIRRARALIPAITLLAPYEDSPVSRRDGSLPGPEDSREGCRGRGSLPVVGIRRVLYP